ncbi:FAD-dependent monooxygenase [Agromyces bauzanensis]|uniref:FAD-dependent monooxygenase n=1 Tax=Agromyces bauzanensis TaxID=1308924 RepID=UPI0035716F32
MLVVGAGPGGLMLAVCLARLGVDVTVADGKDGPTRESCALGVQAPQRAPPRRCARRVRARGAVAAPARTARGRGR